ncbi:MAG: aldehyde dehydrogenase family protein, partial [Saprospiraceae bacterium]|nr:aldehyde dehydrogenase family protein [Saprospiraceae bacterium]
MQTLYNFIAGKYVPPIGGQYLDNYDPATGQVFSQLPDSGPEDVDAAVQAAQAAFPAWANLPLERRSEILRAVA